MSAIKYILLILLTINYSFAQPLRTKIRILSVINQNEILTLKKTNVLNESNIEFSLSNRKQKHSKNENKILITSMFNYNFIFKKDTMKIKVLFDKYSNLEFEIKHIIFKKGTYTFDLKKYLEKNRKNNYYLFQIENFPKGCEEYIKEDNK